MEAKRKKVFHTRPLFYGFLSLMFAIAISRYLFVGKIEYIVLACLVIGLFSAYCLWSKKIVALFIVLISFIFGLGWFYVGLNSFQGNSYEESCQITGRLSDNFECQNGYVRVVLKNVEINGQKDKNIALTIFVDSEDDVKIGDVISFNAEVSPVKLFNLGSFDSSAYRDKTPYSCKISAENIEIIDNRLTFDENVRMKVRESLTQIMGSQGETAFAVLFGDKSGIDSDLYASYKSAGVVHLLTVSGLHITFLITLLGFLLKKIRVRGFLNFLICFVFLGVYVYLCGFTPSVLRAK
ncbi:MAG: ComEC/Rec2 family competence protein, partial [Clostridiales bacterium]|nr:ComEC/Rec2 family competence protein [Clostridiales bacterium]